MAKIHSYYFVHISTWPEKKKKTKLRTKQAGHKTNERNYPFSLIVAFFVVFSPFGSFSIFHFTLWFYVFLHVLSFCSRILATLCFDFTLARSTIPLTMPSIDFNLSSLESYQFEFAFSFSLVCSVTNVEHFFL